MTKEIKKYEKNKKNTPFLDKLAVYDARDGENRGINTRESLRKRAKAKVFTNIYTKRLASLKSGLQKSYNNTVYGCCNVLEQHEDKIVGKYCNNRWCVVCNRIRTAKLINGYFSPLMKLSDRRFLTLTVKNVDSFELRFTIRKMIKNFEKVNRSLRDKNIHIMGVRKLECTYNPVKNTYHPHFHLVLSGKHVAHAVIEKWLSIYVDAIRYAQDDRPADENSVIEMFKYFSKIVTKHFVYIEALDVIFNAMYQLKVYYPIGIQKVSEDVKELRSEIIADLERREVFWTWLDNDWIQHETGECLTGYVLDEKTKELYTKMLR
jgi:plasmid rolling circle replication initiator protein Rep